MAAAIERGPHESALTPEAIAHFGVEVAEKVKTGQATVVDWEDIRHNPSEQLKISPIAAIPHKSKAYRSILDLSFRLRLHDGRELLAVKDTSTKTAPQGSINQIGHSLKRIIHAFAEASDDEKIFMANGMIRMGSGGYSADKGRNGTLHMFCHGRKGCLPNWWYQHRSKWGGLSPHHTFVRPRRWQGLWAQDTVKWRWEN